MMPILFVLLLSFFDCNAAGDTRDTRAELAAAGFKYDHKGDIVPLTDADRRMNEIVNTQQAEDAADEDACRARQRQQRGQQAREVLQQPNMQEIDVDYVGQQPRPQPSVAFGQASTVNTYKELPTCVCAPFVIKNDGAVCPVRCCCACKPCVLPRVVVAGCFATNNSSIGLPSVQHNFYDEAGHLTSLDGRKATLNFAPESVGKFVCICGGCCFTVNQDNK